MHPRWEIPGFDFRPNGGWRVKARRVAEVRKQLLASRSFSALNAPMADGTSRSLTPAAVTGTQLVPALIFGYKNTESQFMRDPTQYSTLLFGSTPPPGNPYTVRTFYEQMSNNLLSMQGQVLGWVQLDSNEVFYTGTPPCSGNPFGTTNCNGIFSTAAVQSMQNGMRVALGRVDATVSFGQFDNDGPDDLPNSGDDDGYVDMIMFAHATRDGACGGATNNHIWSHRFVLVNATQTDYEDYVTSDASLKAGFGNIRISDYFMASGLGGNVTSCDSTQIMPIGTAAHEFGHALGLPDLYDTGGDTEGIGQWGLMGSGNFTSPASPARYEAWSLNELGWVFVQPLTATGTYHLGAAPISDTAFFVDVQGANSRNESFLIENRQWSQADTAVIRIHCSRSGNLSPCPPPGGGGLLIWHIDGAKVASSGFHAGNRVNTGPIFGVKLMQGDGLNQLNDPAATAPRRRGDAGDPYPGVSGNTVFSFRTNPAALKNVDSSFVGFAVDSIRQVETGGEMTFRLRFGALTTVQANFPGVVVQVDGSPYSVFKDLLEEGSSHTVSVADTQLSSDERTRFRFDSWSDGGAATHTITGSLAGGTLTANMNRDFKLVATAGSGGTIAADTAVNLSGDFIPQGRDVVLTASVTTAPQFCGWSGADTASNSNPLTLPMERPFSVLASFGTSAAITSAAARPNGVMGAAYNDQLEISGGSGIMVWSVTGGALPQGVTLDPATGVLSGYPRQSGDFSYQATVTSCSTVSQTFTFSVSTPTLATADVVTQLLGPAAPLNADEVRYLDYLGNNNTQFDIGDFLAWVKATGAPPLSAAILSTMRAKGGRP
ncbi:MAG: M6 family metalloprotease domain-containing protein [Gemmatimonadales bacterium]